MSKTNFCRWCWASVAAVAIGLACVSLARADEAASLSEVDALREVELFAALERGDIEVVLIPRDSTLVNLQVANKTTRPLTVRLPEAFAGVPTLAQLLPAANNDAAPQALGIQGGGNNNPLFGGVMNIPEGKTVKIKRPAVCLQHGNPEPGPRITYSIVPLDKANDSDDLRKLLTRYPFDRRNQRVAQIVAWHYANGKTWDELEGLTFRHINRQVTSRFLKTEIAAAKKVAEGLERDESSAAESLR